MYQGTTSPQKLVAQRAMHRPRPSTPTKEVILVQFHSLRGYSLHEVTKAKEEGCVVGDA